MAVMQRVKYDNMIESHKIALRHIVSTGVPAAILEDDIVLATSRKAMQSSLNAVSPLNGNRTFRSPGSGAAQQLQERSFARHEFDLVPLGAVADQGSNRAPYQRMNPCAL